MTVDRREVLAALGVASASTLLWTLGCGRSGPAVRAPQVSGEVRSWLHDAVARLAGRYASVHALAVSRRTTTVARDVLGAGAAAQRHDGVVITVRDRAGAWREHALSELTAASVAAAAAALGADDTPSRIELGPPPAPVSMPGPVDEPQLRARVDRLLAADARLAPRIVYAAALIEHDDALIWSVSPGRDLEQRLIRVRQTVTRAAWSGSRPAVRSLSRGWSGPLSAPGLADAEVVALSEAVLEQLTPGTLDDGERRVILAPSAAGLLVDALVRAAPPDGRAPDAALASGAPSDGRAPDAALASGAPSDGRATRAPSALARPAVRTPDTAFTVLDDPTVPDAYGGFAFDDAGAPASAVALIDAGTLVAPLPRLRRAGHLAPLERAASHLRVVPGAAPVAELYDDGFVLEGGLDAYVDPIADRVRLTCARARELKSGSPTGRIYPDVELVAPLSQLLASIDAVSDTPVDLAPRGPDAICTSISTPALRTRAVLRATRSRT
jgi:predicted Zn-dependent protease